MERADAETMKVALEALVHSLNVPLALASRSKDEQLRRLIGSFAASVIARLGNFGLRITRRGFLLSASFLANALRTPGDLCTCRRN
jgi:hypothetical protein